MFQLRRNLSRHVTLSVMHSETVSASQRLPGMSEDAQPTAKVQ